MRFPAVCLLCFGIFVLMPGMPALAQNTKGDRPTPPARETRFKTPQKSKPGKKVRRRDDKPSRVIIPAQQPAGRERAGRPVAPFVTKTRPQQEDRAWKGDPGGRRIQPRSTTSRAKNVYPQPPSTNYSSTDDRRSPRQNQNPNVRRVRKMQREEAPEPRAGKPIRPTFHKTRPQHRERAWRGDITGRRIRAGSSDRLRPRPGQEATKFEGTPQRPRARRFTLAPQSLSGRARKVFSQSSFYVNNRSFKPPRYQSQHNQAALLMLKRYSRKKTRKPDESPKVVPRSASASYMSRRSINVWARFPRPKGKQEKAFTRDLAGKKLRAKNFETQRPILSNPTWNYRRRMAAGERPYKGPAAGSHVSATRTGRAWHGDVAHRAIRGGFRSKKGEPKAGRPVLGIGPADKRPGRYKGDIRAGRRQLEDQGEEYTGNIKTRRPEKGGGTVSGSWNNKGQPIQGRTPGMGAGAARYSGNIKAGKRTFNDQGEEYTGAIKFRKPEKGGGSVSGKHWNNNNTPIIVRTPGMGAGVGRYRGNIRVGQRDFQDQGEEYTGAIKARRPEKGGGSISGSWNNKGRPVENRFYPDHTIVNRYSGNMKARRPDKGGGSISGSWNNDGKPIDNRLYPNHTVVNRYSGNIKAQRPDKGGGSVSGKLWNNDEKPIEPRSYAQHHQVNKYSGEMKAKRPDKRSPEGADFSGNLKMRESYKRNPNANEEALKTNVSAPKEAHYAKGLRRNWNYIKNESSDDEAQRVREPGRAFGRSTDFQGNIRLKKFDLFSKSDLHPDAKFVKTNKNNVPEEKDMVTNFKLWWARLFKKADTQPDHLKEDDKSRKPRYDKGEAGLWYE